MKEPTKESVMANESMNTNEKQAGRAEALSLIQI